MDMQRLASTFLCLFVLTMLSACERKDSAIPAETATRKDSTAAAKKPMVDWDYGSTDTLRVFDSLTPRFVMNRVLDQPEYDSLGYALWKPNYNEQMEFHVSEDGKCHTNVDTVMFWTDRNQRKCAAMIFATDHFSSYPGKGGKLEIGDCHFCGSAIGIALFYQRKDDRWRLYAFQKQITSIGIFGEYSKNKQTGAWFGFKQIGDPWTCLVIRDEIGAQSGEEWGYEEWFLIEEHRLGGFPANPMKPIFGYNWLKSHFDWETEVTVEETSEVRMRKKKGDYWDIDLITHRSTGDTISKFTFDDDNLSYKLVDSSGSQRR
jgi:hypothetical protein